MSGRRFADLTDAALKDLAGFLARDLEEASPDQQDRVLQDVAALREEMIERLRRRGDDGTDAVREPRKPRPGGSAAGATVERDD